MPTVVRQFPQQNRNGTQQTAYAQLPSGVTSLQLTGQASDATLSNTANAITFVLLTSPTGSDADAHVIQTEYWQGGTMFDKRTQTMGPIPIDVAFGLASFDSDSFLSLRATFNRTMNVGATVTAFP